VECSECGVSGLETDGGREASKRPLMLGFEGR